MSCNTFATRTKHCELEVGSIFETRAHSFQDQAHLPNEHISLENLQRGKRVVERFLTTVAHRS